MQILRLLAARRFRSRRRAVSKITATAPCTPCGGRVYGEGEEDEGPFFDLDLSCCSAPASSAGSQAAESGSESEDSCCANAPAATVAGDLDFVISLQRNLFFRGAARKPPPALKFCASEPSDAAAAASRRCGSGNGAQLRTLSFGSAKAAFRGGRLSFSRSSGSARSARLFAAYGSSPDHDEARARVRPPSVDAFTRYLSKISSRLRLRRAVAVAPGVTGDDRLRKSRSTASAVAQMSASAAARSPPPCRDDTLLEKQDGIASAIAHCKESLHRASISERDTSLLRSRSDPGP